MAGAFTIVATLAAAGGGWAVEANEYARFAALALLACFAATLLSNSLAERVARPLAQLGHHLALRSEAEGVARISSSLLLGVATGLLWAPCAGPILGLILTGAALNGASVTTSFILLAYAFGAAAALGLALLAGGRALPLLRRSLGAGKWLRKTLGAAVLAGLVIISTGWDTQFLSSFDFVSTASLEEALLKWSGIHRASTRFDGAKIDGANLETIRPLDLRFVSWRPQPAPRVSPDPFPRLIDAAFFDGPAENLKPIVSAQAVAESTGDLPVEGIAPGFEGATEWLNSAPLTPQNMRGRVVLVNFWTFNCINCLHALPYVRAWAEKYKDHGLVVVGVHTPELPFERDVGSVRKAVSRLGIKYPVAIDNTYAIWRAFGNEYWPAAYFIDGQGRIRHHHFGEHDYENSERVIQKLLQGAGNTGVPTGFVVGGK
jgi:cytochrome c biogenesis protein CcdA/thiol-disulfide isomerase/thioredoxin